MKKFVLFYRWGMEVKYNMGLYFAGLVFMKAISDAVAGRFAMDTLILVEMFAVTMLFSMVESGLFPRHREQKNLTRNTLIWVCLAHVSFPGVAVAGKWFAPTANWMYAVLLITFELSLLAMWFGFHVALKWDTHCLNEKLKEYQEKA